MSEPINTNARLLDLVRYMRSELHADKLITDDEYAALCDESPDGRLEDYDELRAQLDRSQRALHECFTLTGEDAGDFDDFRALVDREKHVVEAVRQLRQDCDDFLRALRKIRQRDRNAPSNS